MRAALSLERITERRSQTDDSTTSQPCNPYGCVVGRLNHGRGGCGRWARARLLALRLQVGAMWMEVGGRGILCSG